MHDLVMTLTLSRSGMSHRLEAQSMLAKDEAGVVGGFMEE